MFTIENAQLVLKDKYGNVARIQNLGPDDLVKIHNAIADIGKLVDPVSHLPIKATATTVGVVQLADDEAIAAGTTGRVVDAKQLQDAVMGVSPANCVTNVAAGSTANKIKVTKDGYTTTITIDNVEHASFANQAAHAVNADVASACTGNADTATSATNDGKGQNIAGTYIKGFSVSGQTVTYTRGDGTTGTFTTQDTNTTYSAGSNITLSGTTFSLTKANVVGALGYTPPTQDTNTTYSAGSNITLSGTTFSLTKANVVGALGYTPPTQDTNTTYSAGSNLSLSGTQFNVSSAPTFNSVKVTNNSSNGILFGDYRVYVG